jgi:hypothetical protein
MGPIGLIGLVGTERRHTAPISLMSPIRGMRKGCAPARLLQTSGSTTIEDEDDDEYEDEQPPLTLLSLRAQIG